MEWNGPGDEGHAGDEIRPNLARFSSGWRPRRHRGKLPAIPARWTRRNSLGSPGSDGERGSGRPNPEEGVEDVSHYPIVRYSRAFQPMVVSQVS